MENHASRQGPCFAFGAAKETRRRRDGYVRDTETPPSPQISRARAAAAAAPRSYDPPTSKSEACLPALRHMLGRTALWCATTSALLIACGGGGVESETTELPTSTTIRKDLPTTIRTDLPAGVDEVFVTTAAGLNVFWKSLLALHSQEYTPPRTAPYRAGDLPLTACASDTEATDWVNGASYCFIDNIVAYDLDFLAGILQEKGTDPAVAVLAHEWGHHIQSILGAPSRSLQLELQADCLAGTYLANLNDDPTNIDPVANSIESFLDAGNEEYQQSTWFDISEHGSPVLRWSAFILGALGLGDLTMCDGYADYEPSPPIDLGEYVIAHLPGYDEQVGDDFVYLRGGLVELGAFLIPNIGDDRRAVELGDETWDSYFGGIDVAVLGRFEPQLYSTPYGDWASWGYQGATNDDKVVAGFWRIFDPGSGAALVVDGSITDPPVTEPLDELEYLLLSRAATATYGLENFLCVPGQSAVKGDPNYSFSCALEE
jgi:predicted metalloprotease